MRFELFRQQAGSYEGLRGNPLLARVALLALTGWAVVEFGSIATAIALPINTTFFKLVDLWVMQNPTITEILGKDAAILLAASVPSFFGGWGIREGASAILFGSVGLGSSSGVAVSLVFVHRSFYGMRIGQASA